MTVRNSDNVVRQESTEDLLGFQYLAGAVVPIVKNENLLPATIGVFGDWGGGKSTLIEIVRTQLTSDEEKKAGTVVLSFNGWLFEGYEGAKTALMGHHPGRVTGSRDLQKQSDRQGEETSQELVPARGLDEEHAGCWETSRSSFRRSCSAGLADRRCS
jgi:predicted KAP-like P-loop ATPase